MLIENSTISGNTAYTGAGINIRITPLTVINSTISGNSAVGDVNTGDNALGGGINLQSDTRNRTRLNVINSTISGNSAGSAGGGIFHNGGTVTLINSTVTDNSAGSEFNGGGGINLNRGTVISRNSIIAKNTANSGAPDFRGSLTSQGNNLIGNTIGTTISGGTGDISNEPALIGPLADNGGATFTHALLADSPALDAGNDALAVDAASSPLTTDQRGAGFFRIVGASVDIGAFEWQGPSNLRRTANAGVDFSVDEGQTR